MVQLKGNVALARHSRANVERVEQTYLSTLTAHRSRNRSDNRKLRHGIQLCRQILSASVISSFESSISCTCSILDKTLETKLIAITLEGKMIYSILKDFLARHVILIQINNRSCDCNKGQHDAGHNRRDACSGLDKHK